ncbi:MAG: PH domain-containing protein [Bacteroidota bacterium]
MIKNLHAELRGHLSSDENLLWTGKPKSGIVFRTPDIFLVPCSVLWCGFAIFWVVMASQGGGLFALFGAPMVLVGLMFVFGRFIIDARQRANTIYGITEHRILIKSGIFSQKLTSINIRTLSNLELSEKRNGTGTISFGPKYPYMNWGHGMTWVPGLKMNPQLELIPHAKKVYNQIIQMQNR